ncbi:formate dehydrogenase subunit gamma [Luteibacter sp. UNC138MFCol5.1]|uniref:formate dehydrogenase subunit gamma n=1 Tax=Luteibacter sp. UNC138MFCol5.1 TaxID=1502774 RepID=UPI0008AD0AD1|nr:formate dehydrogenase subunit gamma [Luteibacter sp. UNC138MFCol5.1]SEO90996.1 formate dehydrogenase subunit gamma [Luteibacter sp. UNC138MFCol5.1]
MTRPKRALTRYTTVNRVNHWINAILFVLLVLSGLSFFDPILFFLSGLFGGGQWARAVHPWFGCCLVISWIGMFVQFWRSNLFNRDDAAWSKSIVHVVTNDDENVPPIGRNNSGQKLVFWAMTLLIPTLFVSGLLIWEVYFGKATSIPVQRAAVLIHSLAALGAIFVWIVHVYAAIWIRDSVRSMTQGYVTPGWAWHHHRKWFYQLASGQRVKTEPRKNP